MFTLVSTDVIGIVKSAGECTEITSQKLNGKQLYKRDLFLFDDSLTEVRCTLWGDKAVDSTIHWQNAIVALKGVKIGEYQGRNLGTLGSSSISVNPEQVPEYGNLLRWIQTNGNAASSLVSLSGSGGATGDNRGAEPVDKRKTLSQITDDTGLGLGEKGDYFSFKGTVSHLRHENDPWYAACANEGCQKKVIDLGNGMFRCEKCNSERPDVSYC